MQGRRPPARSRHVSQVWEHDPNVNPLNEAISPQKRTRLPLGSVALVVRGLHRPGQITVIAVGHHGAHGRRRPVRRPTQRCWSRGLATSPWVLVLPTSIRASAKPVSRKSHVVATTGGTPRAVPPSTSTWLTQHHGALPGRASYSEARRRQRRADVLPDNSPPRLRALCRAGRVRQPSVALSDFRSGLGRKSRSRDATVRRSRHPARRWPGPNDGGR